MIVAENLTKYYGPVPAIHDVSFTVNQGEILGFLGPNGAGKTTTIRILTGFLPATFGTASIDGFDIFEQSLAARKNIGYVPENPPLYPEMSVESYLHFQAKIKGVSRKKRQNRVNEVMALFKIEDVRRKIISKLSKGYRQRVGLAQAIVHDPKVIFFDEPTAGLDPKQIIDTRELIKSLAGSHTILLSTHILPEVSMTCNRVVIINEGKVVAEDTPEHLIGKLKGSETIFLQIRDSFPEFDQDIQELPGVESVKLLPSTSQDLTEFHVYCHLDRDIRPDLAQLVVQKGYGLLELRPIQLSLEDIYLKLTTEEEGLI